jgi:hypothetical protein
VPFTDVQRYQAVVKAVAGNQLTQAGYGIQDIPQYAQNVRIDAVIKILQTDTGQQIPRDNFLLTTSLLDNGVAAPLGQTIDIVKVTSDLSDKIKSRQQTLKSLNNAIINAQETTALNNNSTTSGLISPGIYGNQQIPEMFEHMIEDETYDDYGPGSGTRYIIKRPQIKNVSLSENPPDYTYVEVKGVLNTFLPDSSSLPQGLNSFIGGGNGLVTAAAIDYDMWRKFGFKQQNPVNVPFLNDPNSQCAPYAAMILSRARKNILRGSVTITGNEYMQPGEVIFLEDWQMLFYVTAVKHNFSYGAGYTTTLDLAYGHTPGEYIPTTLDVIGKLLYSNRDIVNLTVQRQSSSSNDSNIGVVVTAPSDPTGSSALSTGDPSQAISSYSAANSAVITNILYQAAYMINNNQIPGNNIQASVELRIYSDNANGVNANLQSFADSVQSAIIGQSQGPTQSFNSTSGISTPPLTADDVSIVVINLDDPTSFASPSQKALDMARNMITQNSAAQISPDGTINPSTTQSFIRTNLFSYIVDCWIAFSPIDNN